MSTWSVLSYSRMHTGNANWTQWEKYKTIITIEDMNLRGEYVGLGGVWGGRRGRDGKKMFSTHMKFSKYKIKNFFFKNP